MQGERRGGGGGGEGGHAAYMCMLSHTRFGVQTDIALRTVPTAVRSILFCVVTRLICART